MMKMYLFFLLVFATNTLFSQEYSDTVYIDKKYDQSKLSPIEIGEGTIVFSQSEKLFLVNDIRFSFYENLRDVLNDSTIVNLDNIFLRYEKIINENDLLFELLENRCQEQGRLYTETLDRMKISLNDLELTLDLTQKSLSSANRSLDLALNNIDKSRNASFWKKAEVLVSGLAVGVLIGVLISN